MEVVIEHLGAVQFEIKARGHAIVTDQPRENGGFDEGMTPPELLLASLGSCAAFLCGAIPAQAQPGIGRHVGAGDGGEGEESGAAGSVSHRG
jgi:hypothetical protein